MLDDQVLVHAACTVPDFSWTNRVQQVQCMEKFSVTERFLAVCCTESFTSLFLRTFRTAGFVAWLFSHDFLFATHPSGCTRLRPFSFIRCQFRHCIFYTFQFCCGLHSEYTTTWKRWQLYQTEQRDENHEITPQNTQWTLFISKLLEEKMPHHKQFSVKW